MSIEKTLCAQKRERSGKGPNGRLRARDLVPGVFYTAGGENISVQIPALQLGKMYAEMGYTTVFNLEIDDGGQKSVRPVLIWSVQWHPYKKAFRHIDFYGVDLDKEVKVEVPLEFVGTAHGVKLGGMLETYRETLRLASKPLDMPQKVTVDVTNMGINDTITVQDLQLPANVRAVCDRNFVVVGVLAKSKDETEGEAAEQAPAG
ncbi:MAG: 50S ribosomal protein L25/general stress protein Ctc [Desulfovibrio sp.]|jgi:large subunit ribosomal protein L25|nr:50S ribosomal protein L25/general stress protein Ctc [Desulfovibrio sp.]